MAAAVHMLSVKLTLIARPLAVVCAPRFASAACTRGTLRRVGLDAYATPRRATLCRCFCRATDGPDLVSLEIGNGDDETFEREDFRKFQKINYERSPEKNPLAEAAIQDYLKLTDKELFAQCKMDCYRASGPGGQHRNKTDSAVRLKHLPTGLVTQACEDRSQHNNRAYALARLRQLIAAEVRGTVELEGYKPPPEVVRILPFEKGVKKDRSGQKIGANHPDFPQGVKGVLDLLEAVGGSVADAAAALGLSTGAFSKLITSDKTLWQGANKIRASKGLKPLR